jgi:predicted phage-related endonuclease
MKFSNAGTLSPDDIQDRVGKLTASRMYLAMKFLKSGKESKARIDYKFALVAERMTDVVVPHYVTSYMEHGIEFEPEAKKRYTEITGRSIRPTGFLDHPEIEFFGATPDGFVDDGLIEIKCPATSTYMKWLVKDGVPEPHKPQMIAQMLVTRKPWVDFVAYDPRMAPSNQMFVRRFVPTPEELLNVEQHAIQFLQEVEMLFDQVVNAKQTRAT